MIIGALIGILGFVSGATLTHMSHKLSHGKLAVQFLGVVVLPLAAAWLLAVGDPQKIGICIGAAVLGHLTSLKTSKK